MHNLKTACSLHYNEHKNLGLIASLFPYYNRELAREAARKKAQEEAPAIMSKN